MKKTCKNCLKCPLWFSGSAGHWRTHHRLEQFSVLRHQRRRGCGPLRVRISRSVFPEQPCDSGESLSGLFLTFYSNGKMLYD